MRKLILAAAATMALAAPAFADVQTTIKNVISKGIIMDVGGMQVDLTYTPDAADAAKGTFSGMGGQFSGAYRVDGDKICISADVIPQELCQAYPADKNPGDSFELTSDFGTAVVTINK